MSNRAVVHVFDLEQIRDVLLKTDINRF